MSAGKVWPSDSLQQRRKPFLHAVHTYQPDNIWRVIWQVSVLYIWMPHMQVTLLFLFFSTHTQQFLFLVPGYDHAWTYWHAVGCWLHLWTSLHVPSTFVQLLLHFPATLQFFIFSMWLIMISRVKPASHLCLIRLAIFHQHDGLQPPQPLYFLTCDNSATHTLFWLGTVPYGILYAKQDNPSPHINPKFKEKLCLSFW